MLNVVVQCTPDGIKLVNYTDFRGGKQGSWNNWGSNTCTKTSFLNLEVTREKEVISEEFLWNKQ